MLTLVVWGYETVIGALPIQKGGTEDATARSYDAAGTLFSLCPDFGRALSGPIG